MSKKKEANEVTGDVNITADLIKAINTEFGMKVAYNLATDNAPTLVKRWIHTGSIQLDYMIRNARDGGWPSGRIVEVSALPSLGKSHLAFHAAAVVQAMGGVVVYVDTENAVPVDKLHRMGINVRERFVYVELTCTEDIFATIEKTIIKAKEIAHKDIPILVVWDSVAQSSPKAELENPYDQSTMGLQARVLSKGFRKITNVLGNHGVTLMCLNQLRENIGVMHGDPYVSPGGKAIPFASSVRVRLGSGAPIKDNDGNVIGIKVICSTKKNKLAPPHRQYEFEIHFGKGIVEHEQIFDVVRTFCSDKGPVTRNGVTINISGTSTWKDLVVKDAAGKTIVEKKFYKSQFGELMRDPQYKDYIFEVIDAAYTIDLESAEASTDADDDSVELLDN